MDSIVEEMNASPLIKAWQKTLKIISQGEVFPTDVVLVISTNRKGGADGFPYGMGLHWKIPSHQRKTGDGSGETVLPEDWKRHRCVISASWHFEWEHTLRNDDRKQAGQKFAIRSTGMDMAWLCGLYRIEEGFPHFVILTRTLGEKIRFIYDQMPLIVPKNKVEDWIWPSSRPEEILSLALTDMVFEQVKE